MRATLCYTQCHGCHTKGNHLEHKLGVRGPLGCESHVYAYDHRAREWTQYQGSDEKIIVEAEAISFPSAVQTNYDTGERNSTVLATLDE